MAEGLENGKQTVKAVDDRAAESPLGRPVSVALGRFAGRQPSPHSHKFFLAMIALFGLGIAAIAVAITILVDNPGSTGSGPAWSAWSPPDSGLAGERDIANEVSPYYRASPANQLAVVTVHNLSDSGANTELALRDPTAGTLSAISGNSAVYTMCGLGPSCAISTGIPSQARLLLLRREALELALYTFKYMSGINNVVAILPPGRTQPTAQLSNKPPAPGNIATTTPVDLAVVFQRAGLQHFLSQPLRYTLPEQIPPTVTQMPSAPEAELVSVVTAQALFTQQLIQSQDGSSVLVLQPQPAQ
jgi:hypothetical protein